jgi:hypothetical protein
VDDAAEQIDLAALIPGLFWPNDVWTVPTLRRSLGQLVTAVAFGEFWHNGEPAPRLEGALEFQFQQAPPMKATTTHMSGVVVVPHPIFPQVLEADQMEWRRRELSVAAPWSGLVGARLLSVSALVKPAIGYGFEAGVSGLLFEFTGGDQIGYDHWADAEGCITFAPSGGVWAEGRLVLWLRNWSHGLPSTNRDRT